jgi:hypothetical protein
MEQLNQIKKPYIVLLNKAKMSSQNSRQNEHNDSYIKTIVSTNLSATSFHSVNDIYHTHDTFLKLILVTCFSASSGFLCYLTIKTFADFFSYSVLTSNTVISDIPTECIQILFNLIFNLFINHS